MVVYGTHSGKQQSRHGKGMIDNILGKFTYQKYPPERHCISLAPDTFGKPMSFCGPFTRLDLRLNPDGSPKPDSEPIDHADYESYLHDLAYDRIKKDYERNPTPENKKQQLKRIWQADDKFVREMQNDRHEPMAPIAGTLIKTKEQLEQSGLMSSMRFSGFGTKTKKMKHQTILSNAYASSQ